MKLKKIVILNLVLLFCISGIVAALVLKFHTFNLFVQIEQEKLQERNHQIVRSIFNEIEKIQGTARDWAEWDDSYQFMQDSNQEYIDSNLVPGIVDDLHIFGLFYLNLDFKSHYSITSEPQRPVLDLLIRQIETEAVRKILLSPDAEGGKGVLLYNSDVDLFYWAVIQPITDSDSVAPANGYLVLLKLMDEAFAQKLSAIFGAPIKIISTHDVGSEGCVQFCSDTTFCQRIDFINDNRAALLITFTDESRKHHLLLQSHVFRNLHIQLRQVFLQTLLVLLGIGGVIVLLISLILGRFVLTPIGRVADEFARCAENKDMTTRLNVDGPSEIRQMAKSANMMLEEIQSLNEQLQAMAQVDELTGLSNKRHFYDLYTRLFARAKRNGVSIGLIMIDIDFFKQFNDLYGHLSGDDCLRRVAGVLKQTVSRSTDIVARFGGEEFIVVLDNVSVSGLEAVCRNFSVALEQEAIKHEGSKITQRVTCSLGAVATIPRRTMEPRELISQVDELLYLAKKNGRNRVEMKEI